MTRDTYSRIASTLALTVALSTGGAYAVSTVTSKDIKDNTIKSRDVKNNALTGIDVKDGSIAAVDLAPGTLPRNLGWTGSDYTPPVGAEIAGSTEVALPKSSRLLVVMSWGENLLQCNSDGPCLMDIGSYYRPTGSGPFTAVPHSGREHSQGATVLRSYDDVTFGIVDLPAGQYEFVAGYATSGEVQSSGGGQAEVAVVVLDNTVGSPVG